MLSVVHMNPGDRLFNDAGLFLGTINDVDVRPATSVDTMVDGVYVVATIPERYDVFLTVEAQCSFSNGRYYADRVFELNTNSEHRIQTKYVATLGTILTITEM